MNKEFSLTTLGWTLIELDQRFPTAQKSGDEKISQKKENVIKGKESDLPARKYIKERYTQLRYQFIHDGASLGHNAARNPAVPPTTNRSCVIPNPSHHVTDCHSPLRRMPLFSRVSDTPLPTSPEDLLRRMWQRNVLVFLWGSTAARCAKGIMVMKKNASSTTLARQSTLQATNFHAIASSITQPNTQEGATTRFTLSIRSAVWGRVHRQLIAWGHRARHRIRCYALCAILYYLRVLTELRGNRDAIRYYAGCVRLVQRQYRRHQVVREARLALLSYQWIKYECQHLKCRNMAISSAIVPSSFTQSYARSGGSHHGGSTYVGVRQNSHGSLMTCSEISVEKERGALRDRVVWCPPKGASLAERERLLKPLVDRCIKSRAVALVEYEKNVVFYARQKESIRPRPPSMYLTVERSEIRRLIALAFCQRNEQQKKVATSNKTVSSHIMSQGSRLPREASPPASTATGHTPTMLSKAIHTTLKEMAVKIPTVAFNREESKPPERSLEETKRFLQILEEKQKKFETAQKLREREAAQPSQMMVDAPWRRIQRHNPRPPPEYRASQIAKMAKSIPMGTARQMHELYLETLHAKETEHVERRVPKRPCSAAVPVDVVLWRTLSHTALPVTTLVRTRHGSARARRIVS